MGKKMVGTNEFAFFAAEAYVPGPRGGVQRIRPKKNSKNAFRPVPVPISTFPEQHKNEMNHSSVESPQIDSESPIRIATYRCFKLLRRDLGIPRF